MGALDRRKHDVDVVERVVDGIRERLGPPAPTHIVAESDDDDGHATVELTIALADEGPRHRRVLRKKR